MQCDNCGYLMNVDMAPNYCPNCGTKYPVNFYGEENKNIQEMINDMMESLECRVEEIRKHVGLDKI